MLLTGLIALAAGTGWVAGRAIAARDAAADSVKAQLLPALARADDLFNALLDQETGVRGAVLTGDEQFLELYRAGLARSAALLHGLRITFAGDADVVRSVDGIDQAAQRWQRDVAERQLAQARAGTAGSASSPLEGWREFEAVRAAVGDLHGILGTRLDQAQERVLDADRRQSLALLSFTAVMGLSFAFIALALFRLVIQPIDRLRGHVRAATEDLSHRVPTVGPPELAQLAGDVEAMRVGLRRAVTKANAILAAMGDAYAYTIGGRIVEVNDRLCELTGFTADELIGTDMPYPFWAPEETETLLEAAARVRAEKKGEVQALFITKSGTRFPVIVTIRPALAGPDEQLGWVATMRDISEFKRREDDLFDIASRDGLTGLYNRRAIDAHLERVAAGDALVAIDLDHFKWVNDSLGHAAGDQVLRQLSATLTSHLRGADWAGRLGGEEFLVVLAGAHKEALHIVQRLHATWLDEDATTSFSAGVAVHHGTDDPRVTLSRADEALYNAKRNGRNRVELWDPTMSAVLAGNRPRRPAGRDDGDAGERPAPPP